MVVAILCSTLFGRNTSSEFTKQRLSLSECDIFIETSSDLLSQFVIEMQNLYGTNAMTLNDHQLLHLSKSVQKLGPLWEHSTFVFEWGTGSLLKLVSDANGVPLQAVDRFVMRQQVKKCEASILCLQKLLHSGKASQLLREMRRRKP